MNAKSQVYPSSSSFQKYVWVIEVLIHYGLIMQEMHILFTEMLVRCEINDGTRLSAYVSLVMHGGALWR